jgi:hypothetical protein
MRGLPGRAKCVAQIVGNAFPTPIVSMRRRYDPILPEFSLNGSNKKVENLKTAEISRSWR